MAKQSKLLEYVICIIVMLLSANGVEVPITLVQDAVAKGGVCLDGSPPAYHHDKGFGAGAKNWLVQLEGGSWCNNATTCLGRTQTRLGSSKLMNTTYYFSGILSNKAEYNPEFYNWNRIYVRYCDGSSYTGDVEAVDPITKVFYRGAKAWRAVMDDLLAKGMKEAENAILSGCSAGGLGAILQCDNFRALLPLGARVKCLADGGFFINAYDVSGVQHFQKFYAEVVTTHGVAKTLSKSCTSKFSPELCYFPQYAAREIQTPLFLLNTAYDSWQISNVFIPDVTDLQRRWTNCTHNIAQCSDCQVQTLQGFRAQFLDAVASLGENLSRGMFISSCYHHCQTEGQDTWLSEDSPKLDNTTLSKAVGDWFYERRSSFQKIDCPYPCNKTCRNVIFH